MSSADFSRLTAIVHTRQRPASIDRLVKSVGWLHPQLKILVADDSPQPRGVAGADMVKVAPGSGVSACRNALLARVRTPYFLLLEDALELSRRSGVEQLLQAVAASQLDIAAGELIACQRRLFGLVTKRTPESGHALFEFGADVVTLSSGYRPGVDGRYACDVAHNFFVGRTDKVRAIGGWDPQLTTDERIEFFYRACRFGLKVGVCPESVAWRWMEKSAGKRAAGNACGLAVAKMGVSRLIDPRGRVHEAAAHACAA